MKLDQFDVSFAAHRKRDVMYREQNSCHTMDFPEVVQRQHERFLK